MVATAIKDFLTDRKIALRSYAEGSRKALCPRCSHRRKRAHRRERCLSVSIKPKGCVFHCHNCGWAEGMKHDPDQRDGHRVGRQAQDKSGDSGSVRRQQRYAGYAGSS